MQIFYANARGDLKMTGDNCLICSDCGEYYKTLTNVPVSLITKCESCNNFNTWFLCSTCKARKKVCLYCDCNSAKGRQLREIKGIHTENSTPYNVKVWGVACIVILLSLCLVFIYKPSKTTGTNNVDISKLKKNYPLQRNETWYHFLGILENKVPTVKSVIFLHGEDERTSHCLINELVFLFSSDIINNFEDITFSNFNKEVKDYGLVLEHYRPIVKKYKVLITDLTKVSGNIARIFHSLCDETSSDIKPSLFIFTLKYDERIKSLKPIERAENILKQIWHELPQNEMFPLLSRVIKYVIDVVPEEHCQSRRV